MKISSTRAVTPGHMKVTMPAAIPAMPINASHQREPMLPPMMACASASTPSTSANAPQNSTRVTSVIPGQINASTPKMIAAIPRNKMSHQYRESVCSIGEVAAVVVVDMANLLFRAAGASPADPTGFSTVAVAPKLLRDVALKHDSRLHLVLSGRIPGHQPCHPARIKRERPRLDCDRGAEVGDRLVEVASHQIEVAAALIGGDARRAADHGVAFFERAADMALGE